jgi:2-oxoisovalerate dehydrogenase E2 component (dihydrolipoyl transacylase)
MSRIMEFNLPDLGEGLLEGEILSWLVSEGDTIELNQPIVEVETAKAAVEIPAKWGGVVAKIHVPAGTTVEVGSTIVSIETDPSDAPAVPAEEKRTPVLVGYGPRTATAKRRPRSSGTGNGTVPESSAPAAPSAPAPTAAAGQAAPAAPVVPASGQNGHSGPVLAKPPVRKLAKDLGVDLRSLIGSGPQGSVTRDDVQKAVNAVPSPAAPAVSSGDREQRIPIKGVRKLTAENMVASAFTAPHVTEFLTVDVTRTMKAVEKLKTLRDFREIRISPMLLVAKAVLVALSRHPMVNSTWSGATNEIIIKEYVNLGIAAATERGLIVPNIKDAGRLPMRELAVRMNELVQVARSGKTPPADMAGGTFSITNVGVFGIDTGTPLLPPGEAAILAFGAVKPQPWVHKGKIKVRQVTTLGLSFDHRIIDGELGSRFLRDIGTFLEDPETALLAWT